MSRVVLAMSGGVDSSVAAWLLRAAGHDVTGVFLQHGQATGATGVSPVPEQLHGQDARGTPTASESRTGATAGRSSSAGGEVASGTKQTCCSAADAADARRIAEGLEIPFYVLNFEDQFERIVDHFVEQYTAGRTPNPCILCNTWLKFGKLFDYADGIGAEFVATGHYARLARQNDASSGATGVTPVLSEELHGQDVRGTPALLRGIDPGKDQAYALFGIDRRRLPRILFPVGEHRKEEIRRIAARLGFDVAGKPDSQEICFVPEKDHARFIRRNRPALETAGEVVTTDGAVVGRHDGFERFTVGQRKGFGIALGEPYYVVRIEALARRVVLGRREELARGELTAGQANWLIEPPTEPFRAAVKIRYRSRAAEATVTPLSDDRFHVEFDEPRHAVAPGQAAVCYDGDRVLGGGWIE